MIRRPLIVWEVAVAHDDATLGVPILLPRARHEREVQTRIWIVVSSITVTVGPVRVDEFIWLDPLLNMVV